MTPLPNPKHERFVQNVAAGMSGGRAYEAAGYTARGDAADACASRLLGGAKVQARLAELQHKAADEAGVTLEWLLAEGKALMLAAKLADDFSAASSTYERLAKISGHWVDRSDNRNTNTTRFISDQPQNEEEWLSQHAPEEARPN